MTVLLTVAVKPKDGLKPYLLMGSDSLRLKKAPIYSASGEFLGYEEEHIIIEDSQKIFKENDKLIGLTGTFNDDLTDDLLEFIRENDDELEKLSPLIFDFVKKYLEEDKVITHIQQVTITIGSCVNSEPVISFIAIDTSDFPNAKLDISGLDVEGFLPVFAGQRMKTKDLEDAFINRVFKNSINYNIMVVKRAAKDYLEKAAARYPETCNQNIVFKQLR